MARGQYEIPPGLPRPRPAFGPCRPPSYPPRIVSTPSPSSTTSASPSPIESPERQHCRTDIVVLALTKSEQFERQIQSVRSQLDSSTRFEEVFSYDQAVRALAQRPSVVFMSEDTLQDPLLEPVAAQYIRNGATLCTDPSRPPSSIQRFLKHGDQTYHTIHSQQPLAEESGSAL